MLAVMRTMKTLALLILSAALSFAADMTGKWTFQVNLDAGSGSPTFEFTQKGETLTGMYHGTFGDAKLTGTVKGDQVEFSFGSDAGTSKYSGKLEGGTKISGTCDYGEAGKGTFSGVKN
jgi:hypothetical protein